MTQPWPAPPWLIIIGINEDGALPPEAKTLLATATLTIGGARHLALAAPHIVGATMPWPTPIAEAIPLLLARQGHPTAILTSGDPLWFGIASLILRHVPVDQTRILPAPSAFALAAARLGWPLQDTACLSCCGRPVHAIIPHLHDGARLLVLSADATTPAAIAALLQSRGFAASRIRTLERLGGPAERIHDGIPHTPDPLNLLAIEARGQGLPLTPGLPEAAFDHDGQITKSDIRAITLAALAPTPGALLWDVGAGSGSIGIEWMLRHPTCRTIALEPRPDRAARIRRNALSLGVPALQVLEATAQEALATLPAPDAIFLGGGAHHPGVIETAWSALRPGGRIVANAVTLPTEATLIAAQTRYGGTLRRIAIETLDQVGPIPAYRPAMTITQWRATRDDARTHRPASGEGLPLVEPQPPAENDHDTAPTTVAGIGCRAHCPADAIIALVHQAETTLGRPIEALATPHFKRHEPGLIQAAATLGLPLIAIADHAIAAAQPCCPTRSLAAQRATGHPSIAEACAIAATNGRLILPRIHNDQATCAVATT